MTEQERADEILANLSSPIPTLIVLVPVLLIWATLAWSLM